MQTVNQMKMTFPGVSVNERTARSLVAAFLVQLDPTVEELADIRTAVSEAVTNSIVHGYRNQTGDVVLQIKILEDREVYIRVKDQGCGIPDVEKAMEPLFTTAREEERAGLGFAVMQSFMDRIQVRSKLGQGTTVIMRKKTEANSMSGCHAPTAEEHLGLVHLCANRFRGRGMDYEELYSAGCIGLLKAVKAFDSERGVQFSTYAVPVILGEIKRLFRDSGTVTVSRSLKEHAMKLQQIQETFQQKQGRTATLAELAEASGLSTELVAESLCAAQPPLSLTGATEEETPLEIPVPAPDTACNDRFALWQVMQALPKADQRLLQLRYFENKTQTEIAKQLGISQVQVSRKEKKLLLQLRKELLS